MGLRAWLIAMVLWLPGWAWAADPIVLAGDGQARAAIKLLDGPFARTVGIRQSQIIMRPAQNGAFVTPNLKEIPGTTFSPTLTAPPIRNNH